MEKLTVTYAFEDINMNINGIVDDAIKKALKPLGWVYYAQGFNMQTRVRDIAFEMN